MSEAMDHSAEVHFSNSETEHQSCTKLTEVSERTGKFLREKCTRRVPNSERREIREKSPLPKVAQTRPAQLDPMMKSETCAATKAADKQLTKVQTLLLNSLAPLTAIQEAHHEGVTLEHKEVILAVKSGLHVIGNANAHLLHLRRERIVNDMNKALLPMVGDDNNCKEAAPFLFGTEFARTLCDLSVFLLAAKIHAEAVVYLLQCLGFKINRVNCGQRGEGCKRHAHAYQAWHTRGKRTARDWCCS